MASPKSLKCHKFQNVDKSLGDVLYFFDFLMHEKNLRLVHTIYVSWAVPWAMPLA